MKPLWGMGIVVYLTIRKARPGVNTMDGTGWWRPTRLAVVAAVLFGVFFMHGSALATTGCAYRPAAAAEHEQAGLQMPGAHDLQMPGAHERPRAAAPGQPLGDESADAAVAAGGAARHGSLCLADQPRTKIVGTTAVGPARGADLVVPSRDAGGGSNYGSRAPPISGGSLLSRLCIWRR